jgi:hypothetical protein
MRNPGSPIAFPRYARRLGAAALGIVLILAAGLTPMPAPAQSTESNSGESASGSTPNLPARSPYTGLTGSSADSRSRSSSARRSSTTRSSSRTRESSSSNASSRSSARRGSRPAAGAQQTQAGLPPAEQKTTVVRRQTPIQRAGARGGGGTPLPGFNVVPGMDQNALYLNPPQLEILEGDRFIVGVEFYNVDAAPVDGVDLWLKYNPALLEPTWVDVAAIADSATTPPETSVWPDRGYIRLRAQLSSPLAQPINPIAKVHWRGLSGTPAARIDIAAPPGRASLMLAGGKNTVAPSKLGNRSRVSARVRITDPDAEAEPLRMAGDALRRMTDVDFEEDTRVRLAIVTPDPFVGSDEVATADVVFINPNDEPVETIRFRIRYDSRAVKILDADEDNYITNGINIFDGDFHDRFPFDYQHTNRVDPVLGTIDYEMGTLGGSAAHYPSGTIARIVYRMQRQAGQAAFWLERADPLRGSVSTEISANGISLLGETDEQAAEALHGARVSVRPLDLAQIPSE